MTTPTPEQLRAAIADLDRRQALADQLAETERLPVGVDPSVTVARLLERYGLYRLLWMLHLSEWPGPDVAAVFTAIGLDGIDVEAALLQDPDMNGDDQ